MDLTSPTFESFGFHEGILQALEEAHFKTPSAIQKEVIPLILAKRDLVGQAQTGTGKTGAFGLPAIHLIHQNKGMQMLVMTPTRELAKQVSDELYRFGKYLKIRTITVCGGKGFKNQIENLQKGVDIVVATPGRMLDLLSSENCPNFHPSIVVLDEADEMLDMGFLDDINEIFNFLPKKRQTLLFSATMPLPIKKLAEKILHDPLFVSVKNQEKVNTDIEQFYYMVREEERDAALLRLIDCKNPEKAVIFCRTKKDVDRLAQVLIENGHLARGLHGDMEQPRREEVIRHFRSDLVRFLVATDVAARGLSVPEVTHVFNYHLPFDANQYVHRIGRTGRAGKKGVASTLLTRRDWQDFARFEKALATKITEKEIPSLSEAKIAKRRHLIDKVLSQKIHAEAHELLDLMGEIDLKEAAAKLLSMISTSLDVCGPEHIGLAKSHERPRTARVFDKKPFPRKRETEQRFGAKKPFRSAPFKAKKEPQKAK